MTKKDTEKAERRREVREQRRAAQRQAAASQRRRTTLMWAAGGLVLVGLIAWLATGSLRATGPGERVAESPGNLHIPAGTKAKDHTTNPPTGGEHWPSTAPWGIHTQPVPDEAAVHNLEHGGVWITYKDAKNAALADQLEAVARNYQTKVLLSPRPQNDAPIAVVAWGRILKLQTVDQAQIVAFIDAYRNRTGPEAGAP